MLKLNGILYCEVPDASRYVNYFTVPYYYFDPEHINHFDRYSLSNLVVQNDLCPIWYEQNEIMFSRELNYPAFFLICKKNTKKLYKLTIPQKSELKNSIIEYIEKSNSKNFKTLLEPFINSQEPIMVWGAGSFTQRLYSDAVFKKCNIVAFIDNDPKKWGRDINGIGIYPSDKLKEHTGTVLISSVLHSDEISSQIRSMGLINKIVILK